MKKLDTFSQRILATGISVAMVTLAVALFFQTVPFAKADNFPAQLDSETIEQLNADGIQSVGKYQMQYQVFFDPSEQDYAHFILVFDTETGKSRIYYRAGSEYKPSGGQLPENPL